jgi:hypothetical protein
MPLVGVDRKAHDRPMLQSHPYYLEVAAEERRRRLHAAAAGVGGPARWRHALGVRLVTLGCRLVSSARPVAAVPEPCRSIA